jgi:8-oxo-dGTP pyrophosphatase MutT (NUDIX family)
MCADARAARLAASYDDPVLVIRDVTPAGLVCYETAYSAARLLPEHPEIGLAQLGSQVILYSPQGRGLFHRRSLLVSINAGGWSSSAGGGVDPGETPRQAAVRELAEELGVRLDPSQLQCVGFIHDQIACQARVAYVAIVSEDIELSPEEHEVIETRWTDQPELLDGLSPSNLLAWRAGLGLLGLD